MKNRNLFYIPLLLVFLLTIVVFFQHGSRVTSGLSRLINQSSSIRVPFEAKNGSIVTLLPEASAAGMQVGDRILAISGRSWVEEVILAEELNKLRIGDKVVYTIDRKALSGETVTQDIAVEGLPISMTFRQAASDFLISVIFLLFLPLLSFLLGFYVAFVRPRDPLAWILLMMLLSVGSIALEGGRRGSLIYFFQQTMMNYWGIWMLLFGIYFPERLKLDEKFPWAKWTLLVPLVLSGILNLLEQIGRLFGWRTLWETIENFTEPYDNILTAMTMSATGLFFALLAYKSGTLENKDSRRRLRILYIGTSIAMLPSLSIVILRIFRGVEGGFFDLVPSWYAILALILLLLFPLTMAYVIVVQRAMDVSVVVRQGLQYALAKGGVRILQFLLLFGIGMGILWSINNYGANISAQIGFIVGGIALVPLIEFVAKPLRVWIDRRFFREAYNAEQILSELSEDVRTMIETKPLLETVAARISESLHVPQVALLLRNGSNFVPAYSLGFDTQPVVSLTGDSKSIRKLSSNQHIVLYEDMTEVTSTPTMSLKEQDQLRELNSQILLPVAVKNQLSGIISLSPKRSEEPYTASDLRLLRSVASQTGLALENSRLTEAFAREAALKERMSAEIDIAREVQERLFPQELPPVVGLEYFGACRPALGVGGDYYDFLELPDGKFGIAIGDVSGKGIGASLMMASLQASLRGQAIHSGDDIAGLMTHVNTLVYEASTTNRYATFFYAQYDPKTRKLSYVNAGHNPPFLLRRGGAEVEVILLDVGGAVVGMLPSMIVKYEQGEIQLESGDMLVGFTDGISEAMNPMEEEWGEDSLLDELKTLSGMPSEEILWKIVASADKFADGAKQHDDMTMIIVRVVD